MHGRSMSVDLKAGSSLLPPAVPPRVQPKDSTILQKMPESGATAECRGVAKRLARANLVKHRRSASLGLVKLLLPQAAGLTKSTKTETIVAYFGSISAVSSETLQESTGGSSAAGPPVEGVEGTLGGGEDSTDSKDLRVTHPAPTQRQMSRDKRDIGMAIRTHKERNAMLTRLNSELNQELQEVMEQRIALEIQLEHLRPFSS